MKNSFCYDMERKIEPKIRKQNKTSGDITKALAHGINNQGRSVRELMGKDDWKTQGFIEFLVPLFFSNLNVS